MGEIVKFYNKEQQSIIDKIEDNIKMKMKLMSQLQSPRDYVILEAIEDLDIEMEALLQDLAALSGVERVKEFKQPMRRLLVLSRR